jgi:hypothetical protein
MLAAAPTLAARLDRREQAVFVGRAAELRLVDSLLTDDPPASVLLVHGPGGIGKSVLLREIRRRGAEAGWTPLTVDARDLPPVPDAVERALAGAWETERPLVLLDTYERMRALGPYLRGTLLPSLPERAIVVVAGRGAPEPGWFEGGWETVTRELSLSPLSPLESRALLSRQGLGGDRRAAGIARWAGGLPLALRLAAAAARESPVWTPDAAPPEALLAHLRRIPDAGGEYADVFAVACIARLVTRELLSDVLPDVDAAAALRWLAGCAFADARAGGVTLHELVRRALRHRLRAEEPERERDLRARIADSLHTRALAGRLELTIDLADLVEDPAIRAGYSWDGSVDNRVATLGAGDAQRLAELTPDVAPFLAHEPEHVLVARDGDDALCGYSIAFPGDTDSRVAHADARLGPWLAHARRQEGEAIVWRDSVDFTRDPRSRVQALLNMAAILRSGLRNPRYAYLPIPRGDRAAHAFAAAVGAVHVPSLEAGEMECHLLDYGPGGLLGAQRDVVRRELGAAPDPAAVRDALRHLRVPLALARSPLARGSGVEERAESVRALLTDAAARAFGDTHDERLLRRVLERGYLDPAAGHEQAAGELHLSRTAYFRRLRAASERVAAFLA